jgi:soluble lytic murein transglycosylase-like protein
MAQIKAGHMIYFFIAAAVFLLLAARSTATEPAGTGDTGMKSDYLFVWNAGALPESQINSQCQIASNETGVRPERIKAVIYIESRGVPSAVNPSDPSYGIMQMTLPTAGFYAKANLVPKDLTEHPGFAILLGARYLADLQKKYSARFQFAEWVQAYNVGETKFNRGIRNPGYGAKVKTKAGGLVFLTPEFIAGAFAEDF